MGRYFANLLLSLASLVVTLLLLEGVLRLLPVNEGLRAQAVNVARPVFHFEPNRVAQYSHGWRFDIRNVVRVNNHGFVSDQDYDPKASSPLLALIGDSYVEALMVPFPATLAGRLQQAAQGRGRVYPFSASGAGLAQHMAYARHAREAFAPDAFAFVIIANDFEEALARRNASRGFHTFARDEETGWSMQLVPYEPSVARRVLRSSRLAMYLLTNVEAHTVRLPFGRGARDRGRRFVGNVAFEADAEAWTDAAWAVSVYLDNLPEWAGVPTGRILFVVDGIRPELYDADARARVAGSFWARMRTHFAAQARARGYEVIDLEPRFVARHARTRRRFEFPTDNHWNGEGHAVAAEAVAQSRVWKHFVGAGAGASPGARGS